MVDAFFQSEQWWLWAPAFAGATRNQAPKLFGDPATGVPPAVATFITARPRSLLPSERKRNRPSMPAKPDGLVSVSGAKRCAPCCFDSAAAAIYRALLA